MAEFGGEAENICSHRVFRILTPSRHDSPPSGAKPEPVPGDVGRQPARLRLNDCACRRKVIGVLLLGSATSAVVASGGKVLGSARHPLNRADFSAFLLGPKSSHWQMPAETWSTPLSRPTNSD